MLLCVPMYSRACSTACAVDWRHDHHTAAGCCKGSSPADGVCRVWRRCQGRRFGLAHSACSALCGWAGGCVQIYLPYCVVGYGQACSVLQPSQPAASWVVSHVRLNVTKVNPMVKLMLLMVHVMMLVCWTWPADTPLGLAFSL